MTNGEKLVKVFPDIELYKKIHGGIQIDFDSVLWNAEYKEPTTKNDLGVEQADYENRLKADLKAILVELQLEIEEESWTRECLDGSDERIVEMESVNEIIQQKINSLKEDT